MAAFTISGVDDDGTMLVKIVPVAAIETVEINNANKLISFTTKAGSIAEAFISDEVEIEFGDEKIKTSSANIAKFIASKL